MPPLRAHAALHPDHVRNRRSVHQYGRGSRPGGSRAHAGGLAAPRTGRDRMAEHPPARRPAVPGPHAPVHPRPVGARGAAYVGSGDRVVAGVQRRDLQFRRAEAGARIARRGVSKQRRYGGAAEGAGRLGAGGAPAAARHVCLRLLGRPAPGAAAGPRPVGDQAALLRATGRLPRIRLRGQGDPGIRPGGTLDRSGCGPFLPGIRGRCAGPAPSRSRSASSSRDTC